MPSLPADPFGKFGHEVETKLLGTVFAAHMEYPPLVVRVRADEIPRSHVKRIREPQRLPLTREDTMASVTSQIKRSWLG